MAPLSLSSQVKANLSEKLRSAGLRTTKQRILLAHLLFGAGNRHITAEILFDEASRSGLRVSQATIYNTLNQFHKAGLLHEVIIDQGRSYFDTNLEEHHHFYVENEARLIDIDQDEIVMGDLPKPPSGYQTDGIQIVIRLSNK